MKLPRYEYLTEGNAELFTFVSEGPKGSIKKLIVYTQMLEKTFTILPLETIMKIPEK